MPKHTADRVRATTRRSNRTRISPCDLAKATTTLAVSSLAADFQAASREACLRATPEHAGHKYAIVRCLAWKGQDRAQQGRGDFEGSLPPIGTSSPRQVVSGRFDSNIPTRPSAGSSFEPIAKIGCCVSPQPTENPWSNRYPAWSANPGINNPRYVRNERKYPSSYEAKMLNFSVLCGAITGFGTQGSQVRILPLRPSF
jgi:hypothetical protein